jgi:hypothetical protein
MFRQENRREKSVLREMAHAVVLDEPPEQATLSPWLYAPDEPRRRLLWFGGATLVATALAVRAYLTAA